MQKKIVTRKDVPVTDSPYSPAVIYDSLIFVSGQVPVDALKGSITSDDFEEQVEVTFQNLKAVLEAAGSSLEDVIKTTVFLINMDDFVMFNEIYKKHFPTDRPARSCIEVSRLPFDAKVEIEAIAHV